MVELEELDAGKAKSLSDDQIKALRNAVRLVTEGKNDSARQMLQEAFSPDKAEHYFKLIVRHSSIH
jgi:hypothetical protein